MHIDLNGIRLEALGSATVDLCEEGKWPSHALGGWKDRLQDQLGQAYHDFKQWSKLESHPQHGASVHRLRLAHVGTNRLALDEIQGR